MKIDEISVTLFRWPGIPGDHRQPPVYRPETDLGLLRIQTDDGIEGYAFLGSSMVPASLDADKLTRWLKPVLLGQDPLAREALHQKMMQLTRLTTYRTVGAVDVALWDIAGKAASLPIHALLGTYRTSVPAYASSARLPRVEDYADEAQRFRDAGWVAYKIHPPGDMSTDIKLCTRVREAVDDGYRLMLDCNWSYDYVEALEVGRAIEELGYYWYEDPLASDDIYNYVRLKQKLTIPIMATEYPAHGLRSYTIWLTKQATDFLRGDVPNKGGITTMIKTAHLAEAFGLRYEIHHSANSLGNFANLHVAMAIPNCELFEVLQPDEAQKFGVIGDIEVDADGLVHAPTAPGLGAQIDFDLVRNNTIATLT